MDFICNKKINKIVKKIIVFLILFITLFMYMSKLIYADTIDGTQEDNESNQTADDEWTDDKITEIVESLISQGDDKDTIFDKIMDILPDNISDPITIFNKIWNIIEILFPDERNGADIWDGGRNEATSTTKCNV